MKFFASAKPVFRPARWSTWAVLFLVLFSVPAWARTYHVSKFNANIHVDKDGSALVSEEITFVFSGAYQGVYRDIPVDYPGPDGSNYSLSIRVISVTDEDGTSLKYQKSTSNGYLKLKIFVPNATDSTRMVKIDYTVANATKFLDDHDEFYWNVTGNDWTVPIQSASATVYFPDEAAGSLKAQAFSGVYGSSSKAGASVQGAVASFETVNPLEMREGLTIDVYIPQGILHKPGTLTQIWLFVRGNPVLSLPFWALAVMFVLWWVKGRDPDPGMSVAPMYAPPEGIGPAEAGTLVDESVAPHDITAILVDLAVRGYMKIVEVDHKGLLHNTKDFELHLLKDRAAWTDLTDYERAMLDRIFSGAGVGSTVLLSDLRNHFYTVLPMVKSGIVSSLKQKGMYTVDPESAAGLWVFGAILVIAPYGLAVWAGWIDLGNSIVPAIGSGLIAALIIFLFGRQLTATSLKGAQTRVKVLGFQDFMNRVDADRLKRMPPDTFEKFLPYAMALGVEHRWAKAFVGITQTQPTWYQSSNGFTTFNTFYFINSISYMSQQASSAFVAAPRASSGSSGWSGGGFSSGGFSGG
ncbi:MAG TPA: DUF2207 domain-containing protein, partial [Candidatus Angelobacter sp.]|nr:DUF2207 domain-containing protein [Candidatus Angelobacter sp.]